MDFSSDGDLNNTPIGLVYGSWGSTVPQNAPSNLTYGVLLSVIFNISRIMQIVTGKDNSNRIRTFVRYKDYNEWRAWREIQFIS